MTAEEIRKIDLNKTTMMELIRESVAQQADQAQILWDIYNEIARYTRR